MSLLMTCNLCVLFVFFDGVPYNRSVWRLCTWTKLFQVIIEIEDEVTTSTEDEESSSVPTRRTPIVTVKLNGVDVELVKHDILQQDCDAIMVPVTKELVPMKGTGKRVLDRGN